MSQMTAKYPNLTAAQSADLNDYVVTFRVAGLNVGAWKRMKRLVKIAGLDLDTFVEA